MFIKHYVSGTGLSASHRGVHVILLTTLFFFFFFNLKKKVFGCAESSLLQRLFSSCSEWGLFSSCGVQASHSGGFCCSAWAL